MENFRFTRICREIVGVAIYALYPESFCGVNLAIRKVFAFSDSEFKVIKFFTLKKQDVSLMTAQQRALMGRLGRTSFEYKDFYDKVLKSFILR